MKKENLITVKFITDDKEILDVERKIDSQTYFSRQYKSDILDYSKMYVYADYKLEIENCEKGSIPVRVMPSAILSKIPDELLERVYALGIIFKSDEKTIKYFAEENVCKMGVVVVRLYGLKAGINIKSAEEITSWPTKKDILPIRMTEHEFECLKEYYKAY